MSAGSGSPSAPPQASAARSSSAGARARRAPQRPAPRRSRPPPTIDLAPLPRAADVSGDLSRNWGETPVDLRPLFMLMEETSRIQGAARVFAVIAYRESRFVTTAHNGNAAGEQDERDSSRDAYNNNKDRNPPLRYGEQAAEFGSGGLFGALAPYFLWTGVPEVGDKAPLLNAPPSLVFQPRAAAFGAAVYMQRLLKQYRVDDIADIKVGWANPGLLGKGRGGETYLERSQALPRGRQDRGDRPRRCRHHPREARRLGLAGRPRRVRRPRRRAAQGARMTPTCAATATTSGLADLVPDFDLRSPMDVESWYAREWQAIADTLGFAQQLAAAPRAMPTTPDRIRR
jgi:hypothetical protein